MYVNAFLRTDDIEPWLFPMDKAGELSEAMVDCSRRISPVRD